MSKNHHRTFEDFKWLDQKYYWYWSFKYDLSADHKRDVIRIEMRCYKNWNIYIKRSGCIHHTAPSAAVCVLPTLRSRMRSHYWARVSSAGTNQATMETMNLTDTRLVLLVPPDYTFYNPLSHQATKLTARFSNVAIQSPMGSTKYINKRWSNLKLSKIA